MRIITDPAFISADGNLVGNQAEGSLMALMVLDASKVSPAGVQEAVTQYENPELLAYVLNRMGRHVLKFPPSADLLSEKGREGFTKDVFAHVGETGYSSRVAAYLESTLAQAKKFPDQFSANLNKLLAQVPTNGNLGRKAKLKAAVNGLPSYLKLPFSNENVTIIAAPVISRIEFIGNEIHLKTSNQASYTPHNNRMGFVNSFVDRVGSEALGHVMKEEALHYFDFKTGASSSPAFQSALAALLSNPVKVSLIDKYTHEALDKVNLGNEKPSLGAYPPGAAEMEALMNYFHIRDYLLKERSTTGASAFAKPNKPDQANAVDDEMRQLFGETIHSICTQFEKHLTERAAELSTLQQR